MSDEFDQGHHSDSDPQESHHSQLAQEELKEEAGDDPQNDYIGVVVEEDNSNGDE